MAKDLPTVDILRKLFRYDPKTGQLFWRKRDGTIMAESHVGRWNSRHAGNEIVSEDKDGYVVARYMGARLAAHRVAWAICHGKAPAQDIDHINGVRDDNKIKNLRAVSRLENAKNAGIRKDNISGCVGVSWDNSRSMWSVRIGTPRGYKFLGYFRVKGEAIKARKSAERREGFHPNHGKRKGRPKPPQSE